MLDIVRVLVALNQHQADCYRPRFSVQNQCLLTEKHQHKNKTQTRLNMCEGEGNHLHAAPSLQTTGFLFGFLRGAWVRTENLWHVAGLLCFQSIENCSKHNHITWYLCVLFPIILAADYCEGESLAVLICGKQVGSFV